MGTGGLTARASKAEETTNKAHNQRQPKRQQVVLAAKKYKFCGIEPEFEEKLDRMFEGVFATDKYACAPSETRFCGIPKIHRDFFATIAKEKQGCIGAIDGTHVDARVTNDENIAFIGISLGELKECHSSAVAVESNGNVTFVNTEKQTLDHIRQLDETAAGIICHVKDQHGSAASTLQCTKDIIGIVASLGKVKDEELSRTLSEYLGLDNMLAIVCKTLEGVQALEQYEKDGSIDRNTGLHGVAPTIGRTMKGRFHVFCLQNMRPFVGEFISDDPQKKLALLNPRLPNGKLPPGFLGFAVNMISVDDMHLSCVTFDGYGLRETLFFNLFSRLQVYKSRSEMLCAQPFITDGAVSLDGGMIKGCGLFCLGDRLAS
ncbi:protein DEFECTIVE IN MERISTEM SILENCING 3-like [Phalaenopsis equestris]|uniref:protein DEFECTIVE IN MERISTEM SILENCING 3-like n=1 Tax=Phalaenopsis equestris TaxID=78828 RepID=UPI0009E5249A|nr:protein DEFECTIVE IN MERISTEM SILENCING 3-like [Phalaenopsis equestris]